MKIQQNTDHLKIKMKNKNINSQHSTLNTKHKTSNPDRIKLQSLSARAKVLKKQESTIMFVY